MTENEIGAGYRAFTTRSPGQFSLSKCSSRLMMSAPNDSAVAAIMASGNVEE
jgi:hypothetical protein